MNYQSRRLTQQNALRRRYLLRGILALGTLPATAFAEDKFPSKSIRILCGSPPGSLSDVLARLIGQKLSESVAQPVLIENRPGANAVLAADAVAKAPPDGYTLMLVPDTVVVLNPYVYSKLPYPRDKAHQPVALVGRVAVVLVVNPSTGIKTLSDLVGVAKTRTISYGSGGQGHPTHLWGELVASRLGLKFQHVPYKGTAPAVQAVASGEIEALIVGLAEAAPLIKAGRINAIASSGPGAKEAFPNLPLLKDSHKDLDLTAWFGIFGPWAMPAGQAELLNREINTILRQPETVKRLADFGLTVEPSQRGILNELISADRLKYGPLVTTLGLKAD
jgi:tripartite-type tricarboxylate transporter receptor subunit TctC